MDEALGLAADLRLQHQGEALNEAQRLLFIAASAHDGTMQDLMTAVCAILVEQQAQAAKSATALKGQD